MVAPADAKLMIAHASRFCPGLRSAAAGWPTACPRPVSRDGLAADRSGTEGLLVATDGGGRGITLGPAIAESVAETIVTGSPELIPVALRAERLALR